MIRNFIYLPYYMIKTPPKKFWQDIKDLSQQSNRSQWTIFFDIIKCSLVYSISLQDYFLLRFFRKDQQERKTYAGTGFMYEYQLKMNPKKEREILADKEKFLRHYHDFVGRQWFMRSEFDQHNQRIEELIASSDKLVLKDAKGQAGKEVEVIKSLPFADLENYMISHKFDLLEEFVVQHDDLTNLAPNGLNTLRIITQITAKGSIDILAAVLRLSTYSHTDNLSVDGVAAHVDLGQGKIDRLAVFGDFRKEAIKNHPVSGKSIVGFKIPFWEESIDIAERAALHSGKNKSIGWDIAITNKGPILIEGNHNWGRTLYQLPVDKGLKPVLLKYLMEE